MWDIDKQLRENEEAAKNSKIILHPSSIKTRIDALTEAEAKAALEWAIHKAAVYGSCFECDRDGECRKDDSVDCDMEFLRQALKEARK